MVSYLVSPYANPKNIWVNPDTTTLSFANNVTSQTSRLDNIKLHNFKIDKAVTGGTVKFEQNNCFITRHFFSTTNDVFLNWRPDIGGFFDLSFLNDEHTFFVSTHDLAASATEAGQTVDLTQAITDFKTLFDVNNDFYLYFFCPFMKTDATDTKFHVQFDLNSAEVDSSKVTVMTKEQLQNKMRLTNQGKEYSSSTVMKTTPMTIKEKLNDILAKVKGQGTTSEVLNRMKTAPSDYYSVVERGLAIKAGSSDAPAVEKVDLGANLR